VSAGTEAFGGTRPAGAGDLRDPETAGIAPVPEHGRYGRPSRVFFPWFAGNLELSAVFLGTIAASLGLGFPLGAAAVVTGIVIGAVPVACLSTWGPVTGTAQLPLARMPFGRSVIAPGAIQWGSAVAWIAIGCYFGAQAAHLLLGVPFLAAAGIVLALVGIIAAWGYEGVMTIEKWGSWVMAALFALLTARLLLARHVALPPATSHGGAMAGGAAAMVAIALSGSGSWASYASDYSRYLPAGTSRQRVFWWTMAGMVASYGWLALTGLAAASALGNQTAAGVAGLMGGGAAGDVTLAAIAAAAILSSSINAYSGSLALQTLDVRVRRPVVAAASAAAAFLLVWWMQDGNVYQRITNVLLLTGYWLAPFCGVILIDWHRNRARYTPAALASALAWRALRPGWPALAAFAAGIAAMVPFMNTTVWAGPAARALDGADLSYYVGFIVTAAAYTAIGHLRPAAGSRARHAVAREAGATSPQ
jgi:nucleobase:cation symporter-1, NCS1 family